MFYKMIENKCKEWYSSDQCTVRNLIEYIEKTGQMRDAQIEAIKVYLFLKIGCECKPLEFLFRYGCFNSINLNDIELSTATREYLEENPAATAELRQIVRTAQKPTLCRDMKFLSNILAPKFHRCQFCFSLDTLVVIEIDIIINQLSCFS